MTDDELADQIYGYLSERRLATRNDLRSTAKWIVRLVRAAGLVKDDQPAR